MMEDCLSTIDPSVEYNCTNRWGTNCTNALGFEFSSLWSITLLIQKYCPTDTRLYNSLKVPATPENAALTGAACKQFVPASWTRYPTPDILLRLQTWKFPLFQMVVSLPRPPLGFLTGAFVITHLLGDPIFTIIDLRRKISQCKEHADHFQSQYVPSGNDRVKIGRREWKALALITTSFEDWGLGGEAREKLTGQLEDLSEASLQLFFRLCKETSDTLAADRETTFLPIIVAELIFAATLVFAIFRSYPTNNPDTSLFINVEAHSIAFSALYFWIIPALTLGALIGVSQTEKSMYRSLTKFQDHLRRYTVFQEIGLPAISEGRTIRVVNGGIYSWQPKSKSRSLWQIVKGNVIQLSLVAAGTLTAMLISWFVPAEGWQPRHCAYATFFSGWVISALLTHWLKEREDHGKNFGHDVKVVHINSMSFWLTFSKDLTFALGGLIALMYVQTGHFNDCEAYSLWGKQWLALPEMPEVANTLNFRLHRHYPAFAASCLAVELFLIPIVVLRWERDALVVLLQTDDGTSLWPTWLNSLRQPRWATLVDWFKQLKWATLLDWLKQLERPRWVEWPFSKKKPPPRRPLSAEVSSPPQL